MKENTFLRKKAYRLFCTVFLILLICLGLWLFFMVTDINQILNDPLKDDFLLTQRYEDNENGTREFIDKALKEGIIRDISRFNIVNATFMQAGSESLVGFAGRTAKANDHGISVILDPKINNALGTPLRKGDEGIIVTRKLIKSLGYKEYPSFLTFRFHHPEGFDLDLPIPVRAVVDKIPDVIDHKRLSFICSENSIFDPYQNAIFDNQGITLAITSENGRQLEIIRIINEAVRELGWDSHIETGLKDTILNNSVAYVDIRFLSTRLTLLEQKLRFDQLMQHIVKMKPDFKNDIYQKNDVKLIFQYNVEHNSPYYRNIISYRIPYNKETLNWVKSYENETGYVVDTSELEMHIQLQNYERRLVVALVLISAMIISCLLFYLLIFKKFQ